MNTHPCALARTHRYVGQMKTKEAFSAKCYFESHGPVGLVGKKRIGLILPRIRENCVLCLLRVGLHPTGPSSTMHQGNFEEGDGPL